MKVAHQPAWCLASPCSQVSLLPYSLFRSPQILFISYSHVVIPILFIQRNVIVLSICITEGNKKAF